MQMQKACLTLQDTEVLELSQEDWTSIAISIEVGLERM